MASTKSNGPLLNPGLCRCCSSIKKCRLMTAEYEWMGQKEIYTEMILDCFGILLSNTDNDHEACVCATCVVRLRDACAFRKQLLQCEEVFLRKLHEVKQEFQEIEVELEMEIKPDPKESKIDKKSTKNAIESTGDGNISSLDDNGSTHNDNYSTHDDDDSTHEDNESTHNASESTNDTFESGNSASKSTNNANTCRTTPNESSIIVNESMENVEVSANITSDVRITSAEKKMSIAKNSNTKSTRSALAKKKAAPKRPTGKTKKKNLVVKKIDKKVQLQRQMRMMTMKLKRALQNTDTPAIKKTISKAEEKEDKIIRDKELSEKNIITLIECSYVCPFKCRRNCFYCYYCTSMFTRPDELREHTLTHDQSEFRKTLKYGHVIRVDIFRIDCRLCTAKIDSLDQFKDHITSVHNKKYHLDVSDSFVQFRLTFKDPTCVVCDKSFFNFWYLYTHTVEHFSSFTCDVCGKCYLEESTLKEHLAIHQSTGFTCEICGKTFKQKRCKNQHLNTVHKQRATVYCPKCDETFYTHASKTKHLIEKHGEPVKSFPCNVCEATFHNRKTLSEHVRRSHLNVNKHECEFCDQRFYTPSLLKEHTAAIHKGERNYHCEYCEKTYTTAKSLKVHKRTHSNDRRYKCNICGQAFIQNTSLKSHTKSHHPELEMQNYYAT